MSFETRHVTLFSPVTKTDRVRFIIELIHTDANCLNLSQLWSSLLSFSLLLQFWCHSEAFSVNFYFEIQFESNQKMTLYW